MKLEDELTWYLVKGRKEIPVVLENDMVVFIYNFNLGYIFETIGYSKYITMCSVPRIKKNVNTSEIDNEKAVCQFLMLYSMFFETFVRCEKVQVDILKEEIRLVLPDNTNVILNDSDIEKIFSVFNKIYCLDGYTDGKGELWNNAKARNKEDEEFLKVMRSAQHKINMKNNGEQTIDSLILGVTARHNSYNLLNIWELTIWQLIRTNAKLQKIDDSYYTQIGIYTGNIDVKKNKIKNHELSWSVKDY